LIVRQVEPVEVTMSSRELMSDRVMIAMDIAYATRSAFLPACENGIRAGRARLEAGDTIEVLLEDGGYAGLIEVEVRQADATMFGTDWTNTDPTRFPARVKAAATALFRCNCFGKYVIEHRDGLLTVRVA
jgi:hypothetical protein